MKVLANSEVRSIFTRVPVCSCWLCGDNLWTNRLVDSKNNNSRQRNELISLSSWRAAGVLSCFSVSSYTGGQSAALSIDCYHVHPMSWCEHQQRTHVQTAHGRAHDACTIAGAKVSSDLYKIVGKQ